MKGYQIGAENELLGIVEIAKTPAGFDIIPAGVVLDEPPSPPNEGHILVHEADAWTEKEDHRGAEYWLPDDEYGTPPWTMDRLGAFPSNAVFVAPLEPTPIEKWRKRLEKDFSPMTAEELRAWLYAHQIRRFVNDNFTDGESDVPMCEIDGKPLTVDGAKNEWLRYVGDDDSKAKQAMDASTEAKNYIRRAVAVYKGA